jgi:hypothetical protein
LAGTERQVSGSTDKKRMFRKLVIVSSKSAAAFEFDSWLLNRLLSKRTIKLFATLLAIEEWVILPRVAEAECATCHHIMPKSKMREVKVSRVIGRSSSSGHSSRTGYRHSSGFNSSGQWRSGSSNSTGSGTSTRGTTRTRVDRVWVCNGCKAPRSDGWFSSLLIKLALVAAVLYFGANYYLGGGNRAPAKPTEAAESVVPNISTISEDRPPEPAPVKELPPVVFAPRQEVVQPVAPPPKEYPPCSDTVTDECVSQ